jgi:hypothetical protein
MIKNICFVFLVFFYASCFLTGMKKECIKFSLSENEIDSIFVFDHNSFVNDKDTIKSKIFELNVVDPDYDCYTSYQSGCDCYNGYFFKQDIGNSSFKMSYFYKSGKNFIGLPNGESVNIDSIPFEGNIYVKNVKYNTDSIVEIIYKGNMVVAFKDINNVIWKK